MLEFDSFLADQVPFHRLEVLQFSLLLVIKGPSRCRHFLFHFSFMSLVNYSLCVLLHVILCSLRILFDKVLVKVGPLSHPPLPLQLGDFSVLPWNRKLVRQQLLHLIMNLLLELTSDLLRAVTFANVLSSLCHLIFIHEINREDELATRVGRELCIDGIWLPHRIVNFFLELLGSEQGSVKSSLRLHIHSRLVLEVPRVVVFIDCLVRMNHCRQVALAAIHKINVKSEQPGVFGCHHFDIGDVHRGDIHNFRCVWCDHDLSISGRDNFVKLELHLSHIHAYFFDFSA